MTDFIDGYCERLMPGFWDEPLNAITNASFIIAALILARAATRQGRLGSAGLLIPLLMLAATGIGSFLFHTLANGWSAIADVAALSLCLLTTLYFGARRWLGNGPAIALIWPATMIVAAIVLGRVLSFVPGAFYFGPLVAGIAMAWALYRQGHPAARWVLGAVLVFIPSFISRTLDIPLCGELPYGTHFIWHILNGVVLGLAIWPLTWRTDRGNADDTGAA